MSFEKELIENLIYKSALRKPIPRSIQNYILKVKEKNLITILKKTNNYNTITGIILSIYFFSRKYTITVPIIKFLNIILIAISIFTLTFPNSFFYSLKYLKIKKHNLHNK